MQLTEPLEIPENDILRKVKEIVNHNAKLMLVDGNLSAEGILSYTTKSGESIEVDLTATFLTLAQYKLLTQGSADGGPATETNSGPVALIREQDVKDLENPDATRAMTLAATLLLLGDKGIPAFDAGGAKKGDMLIHDGERFAKTTFGAELLAELKSPSDSLKKLICAVVATCPVSGGGGPTPAEPTSVFTTVHYSFVLDTTTTNPPETQHDYILGDGTYAGTFDTIDDQAYGWWAIKRGVGPVNVDLKWRKRGTTDALKSAGLNLPPNFDRPDVTSADGINTPGGSLCGRTGLIPDSFRTGYEIEVHTFITGTNIELKSSPRYLNLAGSVIPKPNVYQIIGDNIDEGGVARQQSLQQQFSDNSWHTITGRNWGVEGNPAGISISNGLFGAAANSISGSQFVTIGCQPDGSDQYVSARRQIIDTGCTRPAGLTSFTGTFALAPKSGDASRFTSLTDANNRMGAYYDQPDQYNAAQFTLQGANLNKGTDVYAGNNSSCERVSDGFIYVSDSANGNTVKKTIDVRDGKIFDVQDSTYQTPAPIPDTSWSTLNDPFDQAVPTYLQSNGTVWNYGNGMACVNVNNMIRGDTGALILDVNADRILARMTIGARDVIDPRYGVGLKYARELDPNGSGLGGFNLLLTRQNNVNQVQFLHDHVAWGPSFGYEWQPNTTYYIALQYTRPDANTRRLLGKVWKASENEPATWPYVWDVNSRSGQAAIVGGSNYPGAGNVAAGCVDQVWLQQQNVAPSLINVALGKNVTAPANTLNGGFDARFVTDNSDATYSTDCLLETSPVSVVVDLNGLARPEQIQLRPRKDFPNAMPVDFTLDGSLDGKAWTNLISIVNLARGSSEITYNLPQVNGVFGQFRFVRLHATKLGRAEPTDCIRLQLDELRVLAPALSPLPTSQKSSVFAIAYAFVGTYGQPGATSRDTMYFVKNGVEPTGATGIAPTGGYRNLTTGTRNGLEDNNEFYAVDSYNPVPAQWATIFNQAKAQGFKWFSYANVGEQNERIAFRFRGNASEMAFLDLESVGPADNTNVNLTTVFPV